jgi:creatinine amidohydrolase
MTDHFLPNLTSRQIAQLPEKDKTVIVLPIASIEQHGPHLPVYTDSIITQEVLSRSLQILPESFPIYYLPQMSYGKSNEHIHYPGTITLSAETLMRVLMEIGENVARSGFKRLIILNGHGGNTEIIDFVIRDIREKTGLMVFALHIFLRVAAPTEGLSKMEQIFGIHAGDIETSVLLCCAPNLVHMELAPDGIPERLLHQGTPPFMGALNFAWLVDDIAPEGVLGNPHTAEATRGAKYLNDAAIQIAEAIKQVYNFSF